MLKFVLVVVLQVVLGQCAKLPKEIHKCRRSDPNFSGCLSAAIEATIKMYPDGNRAVGLGPLEPFAVPLLDLGQTQSGAVALRQVYTDMKIYATRDFHITQFNARFDGDHCHWTADVFSPDIVMESQYNITGKVLIFPISGHGNCKNHLYECDGRHEMRCEKYRKKGRTYYRVVEYRLDLRPRRAHFDFANIVAGNARLSEQIGKTVNENGVDVFNDVKRGFEESFGLIYKNVMNAFFGRVPEEELWLD